MDSNGDGIGDLPGIESKLDYLVGLGIDALWISPFFKSPQRDFGYDVSDYRDVDAIFGSLADCRHLIKAAHDREIRLVFDLVVNHTSDEHAWFEEAKASKESDKHNYYIWKPLSGGVPNNWKSLFEIRSAWYPNRQTDEYYLATFTRFQPELNWRNPKVKNEIYDIMKYWYKLGVDGFRLDVATGYFKDAEFRSNPFSWNIIPDQFQKHIYDRNRPEVHEVFKDMRRISDEAGDRVLIGETHGMQAELAASSYGEKLDELHMGFNFDFLTQPWSAAAFEKSAKHWYSVLPRGAWPNFTLSNHDRPRAAYRYRSSDPALTDARARVAATMLLTLRGTPFIYYGEELGMTCERLPKSVLQDPLGIRTWPLPDVGRDPERTPMQWSALENAGFTAGKAWLPVNMDYKTCNVEREESDPHSILSYYKLLLAMRRSRAALYEGEIAFLDGADKDLLIYKRTSGKENIIVVLNFSGRKIKLDFEQFGIGSGLLLLSSFAGREPEAQLGPSVEIESSEALVCLV